jgi:hypothetical protein
VLVNLAVFLSIDTSVQQSPLQALLGANGADLIGSGHSLEEEVVKSGYVHRLENEDVLSRTSPVGWITIHSRAAVVDVDYRGADRVVALELDVDAVAGTCVVERLRVIILKRPERRLTLEKLGMGDVSDGERVVKGRAEEAIPARRHESALWFSTRREREDRVDRDLVSRGGFGGERRENRARTYFCL